MKRLFPKSLELNFSFVLTFYILNLVDPRMKKLKKGGGIYCHNMKASPLEDTSH